MTTNRNRHKLDKAVASELRGELAKRQISVTEMAKRIEMSRFTLYRRLSGEVPMTASEIAPIANELGLKTWELIQIAERNLERTEVVEAGKQEMPEMGGLS